MILGLYCFWCIIFWSRFCFSSFNLLFLRRFLFRLFGFRRLNFRTFFLILCFLNRLRNYFGSLQYHFPCFFNLYLRRSFFFNLRSNFLLSFRSFLHRLFLYFFLRIQVNFTNHFRSGQFNFTNQSFVFSFRISSLTGQATIFLFFFQLNSNCLLFLTFFLSNFLRCNFFTLIRLELVK